MWRWLTAILLGGGIFGTVRHVASVSKISKTAHVMDTASQIRQLKLVTSSIRISTEPERFSQVLKARSVSADDWTASILLTREEAPIAFAIDSAPSYRRAIEKERFDRDFDSLMGELKQQIENVGTASDSIQSAQLHFECDDWLESCAPQTHSDSAHRILKRSSD